MIDRSPSSQDGVCIVDPPGVNFAGLDWPTPPDVTAAEATDLVQVCVDELAARNQMVKAHRR